MAIRNIQQLKQWFRTQAEPTQQHFHDWLDSYYHREEGVPMEDVTGLARYINERNNALLDEVNRLVVDAQKELQLQRRFAITTETSETIIAIGEPMTIYRAIGRNISKLEVKPNDDSDIWQEIALHKDVSIEVSATADLAVRITRQSMDTVSTLTIFAIAKPIQL